MVSRTAVAADDRDEPARPARKAPARKATPAGKATATARRAVEGPVSTDVERRRRNALAAPSAAPLSTHQVQAAVEGVTDVEDDKVEFMGEFFGVAPRIGLMPMLKFAHVASQGIDSAELEGLAALYAMIRECIDSERPQREEVDEETGEVKLVDDGPSEWDRFERHAMDSRADDTDLFPVVQRAMEIIAARPTQSSNGSSVGRASTSRSLKASSPQTDTPRRPPEISGLASVDSLLAP